MHRSILAFIAPLALATIVGCQTPPPPPTTAFYEEKLRAMDSAIELAVSEKKVPGAVLWVERNGVAYHKAYGNRALVPQTELMTEDTIFDAASLTKVISTAPSVMVLIERGSVELDAPVHRYIEEFKRNGKENVTVRHLLTHTSGLRAGLSPRPEGTRSAIQMACGEKLLSEPGTKFLYSDINFILLGELVHRVSGFPLERFAADNIFYPLKMRDTRYLPFSNVRRRVAPTQNDGTNMLRGVVHDPTARRMEGVAGHAGLFTTAADLARFARMMLNEGELDGDRILKPESVRLMTSVQSPSGVSARRGLGWDIDSGYSRPRGELFPIGSYGHTGFTGTAMWIDPYSKTFWVLMSNRVHPDGKGNVLPLQRSLGTLAAESVKDFNFQRVPGALPARDTNTVATAQ